MNYKSFITILLLSFLTVIPSLASDSSLAQIKKELRILSKILRTTFMEEGQREKGQILVPANIETLYLKNQGAVMNVKIGSGHFRSKHNFDFDFDFEELDIRLPPVPVAPVLPRTIIIREDYDPAEDEDGEEMQEIIEVAREMAEETAEQIQEAEMALVESRLNDPEVRVEIRKIRDEARKALREQRKALREQERTLRKKEKITETERRKALEQVKKMEVEIRREAEKHQSRIREMQETQRKNWKENMATFEAELLKAICEYGGSLRTLPDNEYLTVILNNAERNERNKTLDRIYVFKKNDLMACRNGEINVEELKTRGQGYSF